jgi:hypothetical protein
MGDSHEIVPVPMSPIARTTYAIPSTAPAMPRAPRLCSVICAVTAVTQANNRPNPPIAAPKSTEPAAGRSWPSMHSAISPPSSVKAPAATMSAAVTGALRPSTVARNSSVRPVSSSARVWRPTRNMPISAIIT